MGLCQNKIVQGQNKFDLILLTILFMAKYATDKTVNVFTSLSNIKSSACLTFMWSLYGSKFHRIINVVVTFKRLIHKNHYDVLNLPQNCTQKDIKKAFIELSKKYHPDKQTDKSNKDKFVQILDAYQTLSKPSSRREYDLTLTRGSRPNIYYYSHPHSEFYRPPYKRTWYDPQNQGNRPYRATSSRPGAEALSLVLTASVFILIIIWIATMQAITKFPPPAHQYGPPQQKRDALPPDK